MKKEEVVKQTNLACEFIEKLYFESSYLIKEVDGLLKQEDEEFMMAKIQGAGITKKSSASLDSVDQWLLKKFSVCFISKEFAKDVGSNTVTKFNKDVKIIYLRFVLNHKDFNQPEIHIGVLKDFKKKNTEKKWPNKVEHIISHMEYNENKVFSNLPNIDWEDNYVGLKGKLIRVNLFDINDSNAIVKKVVNPTLKLYREK